MSDHRDAVKGVIIITYFSFSFFEIQFFDSLEIDPKFAYRKFFLVSEFAWAR